MKRLLSVIISLALIIGVGAYYYMNLDNHYYSSQEFYDFPIPKDAKLESESSKEKGFTWEKSTGTDVPLSYRLMIKKKGWKQVEMDGHNVVYQKDGKFINLTLAPKFISLIKLEHK